MQRVALSVWLLGARSSIALVAILFLTQAQRLVADTIVPVASNGIRDTAPTDGQGDLFLGAPFISWNSAGQVRAVAEFDLAPMADRKLIYAALTGQVGPNNALNTGNRVQQLDIYDGNGAIEFSDYSAPGTTISTFSHPSGGTTNFYVEFTNQLQSRLDAHIGYLGMRITPLSNPMAFDALSTSFPAPEIDYAVYPMGGNTVRFLPAIDINVSAEGGPYQVVEGQGGINIGQFNDVGIDRRAVLEYDISSIPANAKITGAKMIFDIIGYGGRPDLPMYGYAGDGVASIADGFESANQIGVFYFTTGLAPATIDLNPAYIESLLGKSNYLGIAIPGKPAGGSIAFYANEISDSPYFQLPAQLFIQYEVVPEPATALLGALSLVCCLAARRRAPAAAMPTAKKFA